MALPLARWLRPERPPCLICGRDCVPVAGPVPVRHPEARAALMRLCEHCRAAIPWIAKPACPICGRPESCPDCLRRAVRSLVFTRCAVRYDARMKDWLARYKYRGSERLERLMAAMLAFAYERICAELAACARSGKPSFHFVTAVPLAGRRLKERGFNQAERMAAVLADWYGMPYVPALRRNRHTGKQSLKTRRRRLIDLQGTFSAAWDPSALRSLIGRSGGPVRILLADDVYTTGSTLNECAKTLREALCAANGLSIEAVEIYGMIWARS